MAKFDITERDLCDMCARYKSCELFDGREGLIVDCDGFIHWQSKRGTGMARANSAKEPPNSSPSGSQNSRYAAALEVINEFESKSEYNFDILSQYCMSRLNPLKLSET